MCLTFLDTNDQWTLKKIKYINLEDSSNKIAENNLAKQSVIALVFIENSFYGMDFPNPTIMYRNMHDRLIVYHASHDQNANHGIYFTSANDEIFY